MDKRKSTVIVYNKLPEEVKMQLEEQCELIYLAKEVLERNPSSVIELGKAEGLIGYGLRVDKKLLDSTPSLKVVSNISVGYDNLDVAELTKRKILATNTPDVLTETVADAIFGLLLATARRISELDCYVKEGQWNKSPGADFFGIDVHHKTLGIIGMGRIGDAIAQRAHAGFNMNVIYHNRHRKNDTALKYNAGYRSLEGLLTESDFICVMAPFSPETKNLIGKRQFELMKDTAVLIVGSRGGIVDEKALAAALQEGKLYAAGLDVYEKEPVDPDHPLLKFKNVVALPHIGSATAETRKRMALLAAENLLNALAGQRPSCLINPEVLEY